MHAVTRHLEPSVLSSSSARSLPSLFSELGTISRVNRFDLLVPRICDLPEGVSREQRFSRLMADNDSYLEIKRLLFEQLADCDVIIPALATFFPNISSSINSERDEAVVAISNAFQIAKELYPRMPVPIVEVVCGTIVEAESSGDVHIFGVDQKIDFLMDSLTRVVNNVRKEMASFAVALEFEPGDIYLLNSDSRIRKILVDRCQASGLDSYVGLNVDVAHMRIAGVTAQHLKPFVPFFCNAHISDHPCIHTHDQIVGSWTNVEQRNGGYEPYLRLLAKRFEHTSPLPFTGCVAIELEGCNRLFSIHDSVTRLRHAIALAES